MNGENRQRFKEAAEYQRKAMRALLPEQMAGHLERIEQELKAIMLEFAMELVKEHMQGKAKETEASDSPEKTAAKKVEIR